MAPAAPARERAKPIHWFHSACGRLRSSRGFWRFVFAAAALLALSQLLWWWYAWPVRELLDSDPFVIGLSHLSI